VENKEKLLNPILSRFCEIYVPEHMEMGKILNLHQYSINRHYNISSDSYKEWVTNKMESLIFKKTSITYPDLVELADSFYEKGASCIDLIEWLENTPHVNTLVKNDHNNGEQIRANACVCFDKIKSEFRSEKLLLLYMFDYLFLRSNKDIKNILEI
jgi:hypothetical protein